MQEQTTPHPAVRTASGTLEGRLEGGIYRFLGIPYAAPPVGERRWQLPRPPEPWADVRPAAEFGPACLQRGQPRAGLGTRRMGEDCLYLNVWTRRIGAEAKQPVMVWFHGGGYLNGAGSEPAYDGAALAAAGVVLVTLNHRLHVFGYLAHPDLGANFGLHDQIAALGWVRAHIAEFGGDPHNVTIFGESAGADSVRRLMSSATAEPLFERAILQSGGFAHPAALTGRRDFAAASRTAESLFRTVSRGDARAARNVPAEIVFRSAEELSHAAAVAAGGRPITPFDLIWVPIEDGDLVPLEEIATRRPDKPVLLGSNENEARFFLRLGGPSDRDALSRLASLLAGPRAAEIERLLDAQDSAAAVHEALDRLFTTAIFSEPACELARAVSALGGSAYLYRFARVSPGARASGELAVHGGEIPYVFGTLAGAAYDRIDFELANEMRAAWVSFAASGSPTCAGIGAWPQFSADRASITRLGERVRSEALPRDPLFAALAALRQSPNPGGATNAR